MAIPVRNILLGAIVLLIGISPLWSFAAEQNGEENSEQLSYGPVVPDDTLAEIAIKLKGESPWHYQRWMYALYLKNPDAFFGNNMNNLKMGAKLLLPSEDELDQIDLAEAFRAVKVHFYVLQNERQEKRESNEELLLRARLQRLFTSNEMMQKESGELFERIDALEQQMGSVVDRVLESEEIEPPSPAFKNSQVQAEKHAPQTDSSSTPVVAGGVERESSGGWWLILLLTIALIYGAGFIWQRRLESTL